MSASDFKDRSIGNYFSDGDLGAQRTIAARHSLTALRDLNAKSIKNQTSDVMRPKQKVGIAPLDR
jgi:hypothetical protein